MFLAFGANVAQLPAVAEKFRFTMGSTTFAYLTRLLRRPQAIGSREALLSAHLSEGNLAWLFY